MTSPGPHITRSVTPRSSASSRPGLRVKRETAPALPPSTPQDAKRERSRLRAVTNVPGENTLNSMTVPSPPRYLPTPALPGTTPYLVIRIGTSASLISTGVLRRNATFAPDASEPSPEIMPPAPPPTGPMEAIDRKSTRLNSSHITISYAVFCLKKKKKNNKNILKKNKKQKTKKKLKKNEITTP